jgi:plastocyanin
MMGLLVLLFSSFTCSLSYAGDVHYVLQAGRTFLDPSLKDRAAALNDDEDGTRRLALTQIEIKKGDSVVFWNRDIVAHNIVSKTFDLKVQEKGTDTQPQRFDEAGEVTVNCMIHPKMKLKIKVK